MVGNDVVMSVITEAWQIAERTGCDANFEAVIQRRWPGGAGGVGFAHRRTAEEVRQAIHDYYEPRESPEPTYGGACS